MLKAFLEEKATAAVRATRPPLPAGAEDDEETLAVIRAAKAAAGVEATLWAEGVITKRIYELVHRRFLIALAPLGTAISQMEVRGGRRKGSRASFNSTVSERPSPLPLQVKAVIESDWAADVGIVIPPLPVLPAGGLLDSSGVANLANSLSHTLKAVTGEPDPGPSLVDDDNGGERRGRRARGWRGSGTSIPVHRRHALGGVHRLDRRRSAHEGRPSAHAWGRAQGRDGEPERQPRRRQAWRYRRRSECRRSRCRRVWAGVSGRGSGLCAASQPTKGRRGARLARLPRRHPPHDDEQGAPGGRQEGHVCRAPSTRLLLAPPLVSQRMWFASIFCITDIWTATTHEAEYVRFLTFLRDQLIPAEAWKPPPSDPDDSIVELITSGQEAERAIAARIARAEAAAAAAKVAFLEAQAAAEARAAKAAAKAQAEADAAAAKAAKAAAPPPAPRAPTLPPTPPSPAPPREDLDVDVAPPALRTLLKTPSAILRAVNELRIPAVAERPDTAGITLAPSDDEDDEDGGGEPRVIAGEPLGAQAYSQITRGPRGR